MILKNKRTRECNLKEITRQKANFSVLLRHMKYFFTLGNHPDLSISEIEVKLQQLVGTFSIIAEDDYYLVIETESFDSDDSAQDLREEIDLGELIGKLGGTIKVGKVVHSSEKIDQDELKKLIDLKTEGKNVFGISSYGFDGDTKRMGLGIKKELKGKGFSVRYVDSKENPLSSVIVQQEIIKKGGTEICILKDNFKIHLGKTVAVQDFKKFSHFDYDRPEADKKKGMLPPKLAQIMINLAGKDVDSVVYDPFCGNGTVLQQAILLGHKKVIGSDNDSEQIEKTERNLEWLGREIQNSKLETQNSELRSTTENRVNEDKSEDFASEIFRADAGDEGELKENTVDMVVSEPYMGPPLRGNESYESIEKNIVELKELYRRSFIEFNRVLKDDGVVVFIVPSFIVNNKEFEIDVEEIVPAGMRIERDWQYSRENQRVIRNIFRIDKVR